MLLGLIEGVKMLAAKAVERNGTACGWRKDVGQSKVYSKFASSIVSLSFFEVRFLGP
jgi:hypothetical protein